ncbi:MAG: hypothetical protein Q7U04_07335 [Bacteriovorax sp.]|nr:hypothetical protein [Bacteriovorax sp.]
MINCKKQRPLVLIIFLITTGCIKSSLDVKVVALAKNLSNATTTGTISIVPKKIAVGTSKAMAITSLGIAQSWGDNFEINNTAHGQLGLGLGLLSVNNVINTPTILNDPGTSYLSIVSGETQSCGITNSQNIKCWGTFVGSGSGNEADSPTLINDDGLTFYSDISAGSYHTCAITRDGVMKCWGDGWDGKLGNSNGTGAIENSPITANIGTSYKRVAAGRNHTCAITNNDKIQCWGNNSLGQLGDGTNTSPRLSAVNIDPSTSYEDIAAGEDSTCAITTAGILKCWGANGYGQVGNNTLVNQFTPIIIDAGTTYAKVALSATFAHHTCAITTAGALKCWGSNSNGQLGNGTTGTPPSQIPLLIDAGIIYREISVSFKSSCGITIAGSLKCWGDNGSGQLGLGNTTQKNTPTLVAPGY